MRAFDSLPPIRCGKRPRTVLPERSLAALRRAIQVERARGELLTTESFLQWRRKWDNRDEQADGVYEWQAYGLDDLFFDHDERLGAEGAAELIAKLQARHLSHRPHLSLRVVDGEGQPGERPEREGAFQVDSEGVRIVLYRFGDQADWDDGTLIHEFAHAVVYSFYGGPFQGVQGHGPEFVGVLCFLIADLRGVDVAGLLRSAVADGLRVLPFDPRRWVL